MLAGLVHDLGHGPFSHVFDGCFIRQLQENKGMTSGFWTHEEGSTMMFRDLVDSNQAVADVLTEDDVKQINNLVLGGKPQAGEKAWIYEIVSNSRNGIDVDKFDYINRDTQKMNVKNSSFNHEKIMKSARVIEDEICYNSKEDFEISKLFSTRYNLYRDCYNHRVT